MALSPRSPMDADMIARAGGATAAQLGLADGVTTATLGSTTPNGGNSVAGLWSNGEIIPEGARIDSVSARASASMQADILLVDALTRVVLATKASVAFASGVSTVGDPFSGYVSASPAILFINSLSGGVTRLVTGVSSGVISLAAASYAVGDTLPAYTRTPGYAVAIAVGYSYSAKAVAPRANRLERARAASVVLDTRGDAARGVVSAATFAAAGSSTTNTRNGVRYLGRGVLRSVAVTVQSDARGLLEHWRAIDGVITLMDVQPANLVAGSNTVAIPDWPLSGESYIAYRQISGVNVSYASYGTYFELTTSTTGIGATATAAVVSGFSLVMALTVTAPAGATQYEMAADGPATFDRRMFAGTGTPAKWTVAAPFSVSDGLLASTAGGWSSFAGWNELLSVHKRRLFARVKINDTDSIFGLACKPDTSASAVGGAVAMVDGTAGKLSIYAWNGTTSGSLAVETAFTAALVTAREYLIEVVIDGQVITSTLTDLVTRVVTSASGTFGAGAVTARFHGRPGILHISGDIAVQWTHFALDAPRACKAVIYGDSNLEAVATGVTYGWAYNLGPDVLVSARSGEASIDMVKRLPELVALRPKMAICAHGTNDTRIETWRHNVGSFVDTARAINAEPILVRPLPQPGKQALMTAIDSDITAGYFGRLRSIDFLGACSDSNDRLTWNATFDSGDHLHANDAGQAVMLAQALVDIPELVAA